MNVAVDNFRYETWELDEIVSAIEKPANFLVRMFFPNVKQFDTPTIEFDIEEGGRRLAPFVSPLVPGVPVRGRGVMTAAMKPAYIKPKGFCRPGDSFTRRPGETPYGGKLTPRQRMDRIIAEKIADHADMIDNRLEWMAGSALVNGAITVSGEDYPAVTVDFNQDSNLRVTLGVGVKWSETNGVPLDDIENLAIAIRRKSYGAVVTDIVMDGGAWKYFRKKMEGNVNFAALQRLGSSQLESAPSANIDGELKGHVGSMRVWVYDAHYEDNDGVSQPFLPPYTCLLVAANALEGKQYFGAIQDLDADMVSMKHFVKSKTHFDPSAVEILSQSAPLIAPRRRNAFGRITVHS